MDRHNKTLDFINNGDIKHYSPLHVAAANGYDVIAGILIAAGATVNLKSKTKTAPLHVAAQSGHIK